MNEVLCEIDAEFITHVTTAVELLDVSSSPWLSAGSILNRCKRDAIISESESVA